jgi:hypothetical protein
MVTKVGKASNIGMGATVLKITGIYLIVIRGGNTEIY